MSRSSLLLLRMLLVTTVYLLATVVTAGSAQPARCLLPAETGRCRASFRRYHYNASAGACLMFIYGGCGGNQNNFLTEQDCRDACVIGSVNGGFPPLLPTTTNGLECGANEVPDQCGNHCDARCGVLNPVCTYQCGPPACSCRQGYARHPNGSCVARHECPAYGSSQCGPNEKWDVCGNHCDERCGVSPTHCTLQCGPPACSCVKGFARHPNGSCIARESCPDVGFMPIGQAPIERYYYNNTTRTCQKFMYYGNPPENSENNFATLSECSNLCKAEGSSQCGVNEKWNICGNHCDERCGDIRSFCTLQCGPPACSCQQGFARHPNGSCVAKDSCPPVRPSCGVNEKWNECGNHCDERCGASLTVCTRQCGPAACSCLQGFARHSNGSCVAKDSCPPVIPSILPSCAVNEKWNECGNHCDEQCGTSPTICTRQCGPPACSCLQGFTRHPNGSCVAKDSCPPVIPSDPSSCVMNEKWNECGNHCDERCGASPTICTRQCGPAACSCLQGFARHSNGSCVAKDSCPPVIPSDQSSCAVNEKWNECGSHCDERCGTSPTICTRQCGPPACSCLQGFTRHPNGSCVAKDSCPFVRSSVPSMSSCGVNEKWNECGNHCDERCGTSPTICTRQCGPPACSCLQGFTRHPNGSCVAKDSCPCSRGGESVDDRRRDGPCTKATFGSELNTAQQPLLGALTPECNDAGFYKLVQCHGSTGYCWCVHAVTGDEVQGTRKAPGTGPPQCPECHKRLAETAERGNPPGAMVHSCTNDGLFEEIQCHGSIGYCWCVDQETGAEVPGTRVRGRPQCPGKAVPEGDGAGGVPGGRCKDELDSVNANTPELIVGAFRPQCNEAGWYELIQCHGSTGECWCVDALTGKEVSGTRKRPGRGRPFCSECHKRLAETAKTGNPPGAVVHSCTDSGEY